MRPATILIVENNSLFRDGLRARLEAAGHRILAETDGGSEAITLVKALRPDVVLLADELADISGISVCREIRAISRRTRVLIMALERADDAHTHLAALHAGAVGCVRKDILPEQWVRVVTYILNGGAIFKLEAIRRALSSGTQVGRLEFAQVTEVQDLSPDLDSRRILVVDRPSLFRSGLVTCLEDGGFHAVREASGADQAMDVLAEWPAELVIAGAELPEVNGFALTREVRVLYPDVKVLLTSWHADDESVQLRARQAGAVGCVSKHLSAQECLIVVAEVLAGRHLYPDADPHKSRYYVGPDGRTEPLTPREQDVIELIAGGLTNRQIADTLCISERTVDRHVGSILSKLGVSSRTEAAVVWVQGPRS